MAHTGVHWMQKPENKGKVLKMIKKMHRGKQVAKRKTKAEKIVAKAVKRHKKVVVNPQETVSVVLNGWKLTLGVHNIIVEKA
jgi:hypothetical protein